MVNNDSSDEALDTLDKEHQNGSPDGEGASGNASARYSDRRPALDEDLFQRYFGGSQSDPLEAVHTASGDPKEYLVRSYLPERTIRLILLENSQVSGVLLGFVNPSADNVMLMHMVRSGIGPANSMERMERMYIGKREADREAIKEHFVRRFQTLNNEQVELKP